ncbi:MAG: VWA domain-containing protein [Acidobacteriota bacterium]
MTALLIASLAAILAPGPAQQQPVFRADVQLVEVGAVVLDKQGRPVSGLTLEDFEIREDGRPVKIVAFVPMAGGREHPISPAPALAKAANQASGRFVVLLLDDVFITPLRTPKIRELATKFIDRLSGADEIAVVKLNGGQSVSTTSREQARAALAKYTRDRPPTPGLPGEWRARIDGAMDTVAELARQLSIVRHRRKALVFIGSPVLFAPTVVRSPAASTYSPSWYGALRALAAANVSVYYIDPRGLVPDGPDGASTSPTSIFGAAASSEAFDHPIAFAHETGGSAFVRSNLFDRALDQIWRESADYYVLGYEPPVNDGKPHRITVEVRGKGLEVRARKTR